MESAAEKGGEGQTLAGEGGVTGRGILFGFIVFVIIAVLFVYNGGFMHGDPIE